MATEQLPQSLGISAEEQQFVAEQMEQARDRILPFLRDHFGLPQERSILITGYLDVAQNHETANAADFVYLLGVQNLNEGEVFREYAILDELNNPERNLVAWDYSLLAKFEDDPKISLPWSVDTLLETAVNCRHILTSFPASDDPTLKEFDQKVIESLLFHVDQKVLRGLAIHIKSGKLSYGGRDSIKEWAKRLAHHNLSWLSILEKVQSVDQWESEYQLAAMTTDLTNPQTLSLRAKTELQDRLNGLFSDSDASEYRVAEIDTVLHIWKDSDDIENKWSADMKQKMADVLFTQLVEPHPELFVHDIDGIHEKLMLSLMTYASENQTKWYQKVFVHLVDYAFKNNYPLPSYIPRPNTDY